MDNIFKDCVIETNKYEIGVGNTFVTRSATFKHQVQIIPKHRFKECYDSSFFVRRQIGLRRLSVMMGCHPRIGENSPFRNVLSKDVTRWFLKKYINPETQCYVTNKQTKVWIVRELNETDFDVVFTNLDIKNTVKFFTPHIITTELVMYPIVIQTPKIALTEWMYMSFDKYRLRGIFDRRSTRMIEEFKNNLEIIDMRCREWVLQKSESITGKRQVDFGWVNRFCESSVGKFYIENMAFVNTKGSYTTGTGLSVYVRSTDTVSIFEKDGRPSKATKNKFFGANYENTSGYRWVKLMVVLESYLIHDSGLTPYWKLIQCKEVEPPKTDIEYEFLSSDEE